MYACVYAPGGGPESRAPSPEPRAISALTVLAQQFSPRYETRGDRVVIDVRGLDRLLGDARTIGEELRREAADCGLRAHVAVAGTQTAARVLAIARPGLTVVDAGEEAKALAPVSIDVLAKIKDDDHDDQRRDRKDRREDKSVQNSAISAFKKWGLKTLGEIAALPAADLSARLGRQSLLWQAMARGDDIWPLVPDLPEERFDASLDLEWPIEGLEPLSFVLTRLLEPLSIRLERRDRGVAVLHVQLGLVTKDTHTRRLELPSPLRDVRALRTLALLDLESHPPPGDTIAIDRVRVVIDPTPGRVLQHTLFARPHPAPEQLSTLLARLGAAMGQDRIGAPAVVDSYRPGVFAMKPFAVEHPAGRTGGTDEGRKGRNGGTGRMENSDLSLPAPPAYPAHPASPLPASPAYPALPAAPALSIALRRCRQPVPARVAVDTTGRPVRVTTDRRGFAGGSVLQAAGPWKTSGEWWLPAIGEAGRAGWDRDEWDVALSDGGAYRVFLDHPTHAWFIDAVID